MGAQTQLGETVRTRVVAAAARLLAEGGREAVTTRAVAQAAGIQAPTIYRQFGDMRGLLDAVAEHGLHSYLTEKGVPDASRDPVDDLRAGWDLHVMFGLANPAVYALIYGDPRPGVVPPAAEAAVDVLRERIRRIAAAGRLRVPERRAVEVVQATGQGTVLTLLSQPPAERDMALSDTAREATIAAITTDASPGTRAPGPAAAANALRAVLPDTTALTDGERLVLGEWLDRIAAAPPGGPAGAAAQRS